VYNEQDIAFGQIVFKAYKYSSTDRRAMMVKFSGL
jgi:hypothetical protein